VAGLDALLVGDVEGESGHADGSHLGEHGWVAGRCNDMHAWRVSGLWSEMYAW
jgi:hypothetical protein